MIEKASQTNGKTGVWGAFLLGSEQKNKNGGIESLEVFTYLSNVVFRIDCKYGNLGSLTNP